MNGDYPMTTWTREDLFAFLAEQPRIGRLATMTPEQDPHVAPVWFRVDDDRILVHTMAGYKKARNLASHPRFALTVDTEEWPYKGVTIRGSATFVEADAIDHHEFVENVTVSYLGEAYRPMGRAMGAMAGDHVILMLDPETWSSFDYSSN